MKIFGAACAALAAVCSVAAAPVAIAADVNHPIATPLAPGCNAGYSWQKIGVRYQCVTPEPTCQYGFASTPVWNGGAWNYACALPPPPPPPPPTEDSCESYPKPGYTPQRGYQWVDASNNPGGGSTNWPVVRQSAGVPANAVPYWALYDVSKGWSIYWTGPSYATCSGSGSNYTTICWVNPDNNSVYKMSWGQSSTIPQNGCGLQH